MKLPSRPFPQLRHADGSLWEASWNDETGWIVGMFNECRRFFFRKLEPNPARRWWCPWRPVWRRTGETWEGGPSIRDGGFSLLK